MNEKTIVDINNYTPVYADAKIIIQILVAHGVIKSHSGEEEYIKTWDAALSIAKKIKGFDNG